MDLFTAKKLTALRKHYRLSQEALAEKIGVSRQTVSKWERGEASPDTDNVIALAKLYNVTVDGILGETSAEKLIALINGTADNENISPAPVPSETAQEDANKAAGPEDSSENTYKTDTLAKTQNSSDKIGKINRIGKALMRFPFFLAVITVYLVLGLAFSLWHPGWAVFILIPAYYVTALALTAPTIKKIFLRLPVYLFAGTVYAATGFSTGIWHPTWLIFLIIPFYYWGVAMKRGRK